MTGPAPGAPEALAGLRRELGRLVSGPLGRRALLASLPALLAACASAPRHRHREGDNTGQEAALTPEEERRMTQEHLPRMRKEYPPVKDAWLQGYVGGLGSRITEANGLAGRPYRYDFEAVESKAVNAFALPAGRVFVTRPLLAMAGSEAELAGVLGHEVGHVQARHAAERIAQARRDRGRSFLYGIGGAVLGGAAGFGVGRLLCGERDRECLRRAARYGAAAGGMGGLLIQKFAFMANSREDEMEADRIGFRTSVGAGFHPDHVGGFYAKLLEMERGRERGGRPAVLGALADAMSTHPPSEERVAQMDEMRAGASGRGGDVSSRDFARMKRLVG